MNHTNAIFMLSTSLLFLLMPFLGIVTEILLLFICYVHIFLSLYLSLFSFILWLNENESFRGLFFVCVCLCMFEQSKLIFVYERVENAYFAICNNACVT